ncbi:hypothetical protein PENTCL1PPCAC_5081, partial [Pristionchus entomophagus]
SEPLFTAKGKVFLDCVRPCLANFVRTDIIGKSVTNCTDITNLAFGSHVTFYTKCNFCGVVISNIIPFVETFQLSSFLSVNAVEQV